MLLDLWGVFDHPASPGPRRWKRPAPPRRVVGETDAVFRWTVSQSGRVRHVSESQVVVGHMPVRMSGANEVAPVLSGVSRVSGSAGREVRLSHPVGVRVHTEESRAWVERENDDLLAVLVLGE